MPLWIWNQIQWKNLFFNAWPSIRFDYQYTYLHIYMCIHTSTHTYIHIFVYIKLKFSFIHCVVVNIAPNQTSVTCLIVHATMTMIFNGKSCPLLWLPSLADNLLIEPVSIQNLWSTSPYHFSISAVSIILKYHHYDGDMCT